ncbi:hypothetical protein [Natrinema sp. SYSU A 869]|uniref:hypothetical protein n=1 Tax=Natrinema sp. SYSU A 869 TaxID=2871694 RepID=UPI002106F9AE|nr:hypothetical protein [Natrinema sp. SYSU A 869]
MPLSLRRRQLLGAVAAVVPAVVAGCWGHGPSLTMRETSDSDLLSSAASTIPVDTTSDRLRPIVETIETGTTKLSSPSPRPRVEPAQPVVASAVQRPIKYDGAYYTLSLSKTVERTLIEAEFHIGTAGTPPEDTAKPIEYDALPERDRESLEGALPPETGERDYESVQTFYDEQEVDTSELVPETEYDAVVRDGQRYSLELAHTEKKSGYNYHYTAERVATTDDDFLSWLRSRYRYELTGLSEGEQKSSPKRSKTAGTPVETEKTPFRHCPNGFSRNPRSSGKMEQGNGSSSTTAASTWLNSPHPRNFIERVRSQYSGFVIRS